MQFGCETGASCEDNPQERPGYRSRNQTRGPVSRRYRGRNDGDVSSRFDAYRPNKATRRASRRSCCDELVRFVEGNWSAARASKDWNPTSVVTSVYRLFADSNPTRRRARTLLHLLEERFVPRLTS